MKPRIQIPELLSWSQKFSPMVLAHNALARTIYPCDAICMYLTCLKADHVFGSLVWMEYFSGSQKRTRLFTASKLTWTRKPIFSHNVTCLIVDKVQKWNMLIFFLKTWRRKCIIHGSGQPWFSWHAPPSFTHAGTQQTHESIHSQSPTHGLCSQNTFDIRIRILLSLLSLRRSG